MWNYLIWFYIFQSSLYKIKFKLSKHLIVWRSLCCWSADEDNGGVFCSFYSHCSWVVAFWSVCFLLIAFDFMFFQINAESNSDDAIEVTADFFKNVLLPAFRMLKRSKMISDATDSNQQSVCLIQFNTLISLRI